MEQARRDRARERDAAQAVVLEMQRPVLQTQAPNRDLQAAQVAERARDVVKDKVKVKVKVKVRAADVDAAERRRTTNEVLHEERKE